MSARPAARGSTVVGDQGGGLGCETCRVRRTRPPSDSVLPMRRRIRHGPKIPGRCPCGGRMANGGFTVVGHQGGEASTPTLLAEEQRLCTAYSTGGPYQLHRPHCARRVWGRYPSHAQNAGGAPYTLRRRLRCVRAMPPKASRQRLAGSGVATSTNGDKLGVVKEIVSATGSSVPPRLSQVVPLK